MRKKLVMSMLIAVMAAGSLAGGAVAAFADLEGSGENSFQAGTLDLKTDDVDGVTQSLYATSMKPGASIGPATIVLRNIGSLSAPTLNIDVSYVNNDGDQPSKYPGTVTADQFADELIVNTLTYDGTDLTTGISDQDADGIDMKEVAAYTFPGQSGLNPGTTKDFVVQVTLKAITNNDFQADGIDINLTFTLGQ